MIVVLNLIAIVALLAGVACAGHLSERATTTGNDGTVAEDARLYGSAERLSRPVTVRSEKCLRVLAAVRFYSRRLAEHRAKMGADSVTKRSAPVASAACPRYLAHVLQRKARAWRLRAEAWIAFHYHWHVWLPANWRRLGACETGYGREPGNWRHENGSFVSAFGISRAVYGSNAARAGYLGWDETKRELGRYPTPREQYENGLSHLAHYGDGWTCPGP